MSTKTNARHAARGRRQRRVRKKVFGTPERPRLAVFRSNRHISAQVIDDTRGHTIAAASSYEAEIRSTGSTGTVDAAAAVGALLGKRATDAGVEAVVFDRGGNRYHGRVAALADSARSAGLEF
jgi:large subunit ribosomal protein L18